MKRLILFAVLAASSLACVANQGDAPVRFLGAQKLDATCTGTETVQVTQGQLDISGGSSYVLSLLVESNITNQEILIGGEPFTGSGHGDFTLNEVILTYAASGVSLPKEERIPVYTVFRPSGSGPGNSLNLYALGPAAVTALKTVAVGSSVTVLVTLKAAGKLSSGASVETNEVTFPIVVINSGYNPAAKTCSSGTPRTTDAWTCGNLGQDLGAICR